MFWEPDIYDVVIGRIGTYALYSAQIEGEPHAHINTL